jgi:hypothetical protein
VLQSKSIEQVAVENLRLLFTRADSPQALLRALRSLPHPRSAAVDDLEAAIASSRLPVGDEGALDGLAKG